MSEMTKEFDKWVMYVGNDLFILKTNKVFQKRLNYVGNDVDLSEMAQICGKMA